MVFVTSEFCENCFGIWLESRENLIQTFITITAFFVSIQDTKKIYLLFTLMIQVLKGNKLYSDTKMKSCFLIHIILIYTFMYSI